MNYNEEEFLLKRLRNEDVLALEVLFNRYYTSLCRYLYLLFKNQIIIEHVVQDVFVYVWENRHSIEINSSIESYLYAACRYKALNQLRNTKRQTSIQQGLFENQQTAYKHIEEKLEAEELQKIIEEAINGLPERCRQIFLLSRQNDLSYKEIASLLNISVNTIENQMSIALKKLRSTLKPYNNLLFNQLLMM